MDSPCIIQVVDVSPLADAFLLGELAGLRAKVEALTAMNDAMHAQISERDARIAILEREVRRQMARASSARGALLMERTYGGQF